MQTCTLHYGVMSSYFHGAAGTIFCAPEHLSIAACQCWPLKLFPHLHCFCDILKMALSMSYHYGSFFEERETMSPLAPVRNHKIMAFCDRPPFVILRALTYHFLLAAVTCMLHWHSFHHGPLCNKGWLVLSSWSSIHLANWRCIYWCVFQEWIWGRSKQESWHLHKHWV